MSLLLKEDKSSSTSSPSLVPSIIKWIVISVLLSAVAIAAFLGLRVIHPSLLTGPVEEEDTSIPADAFTPSSVLDGDLVLGLVIADSADETKVGLKTAVYRSETGGGVEIPDVDIAGKIHTPFQLNFSKDTTYATYLGAESNGSELYRSVINKGELTGSDALVGQLRTGTELPAPDTADYLRHLPVINNSGFVLYASLPEDVGTNAASVASTSIDAWSIYLVTDENERLFVTKGFNPKWLSGSSFTFVQKDGVYVYDLDLKTSRRVWDAHEMELTAANGFAVSNDFLTFAISDRRIPVSLYDIGDWESDEAVLFAKSDAYASSLEFSADDEYVGAVVRRIMGGKVSFGVEYYSREEQKLTTEKLVVDEATIKGLYISDWQ
jgi:hypothetical protein